MSSGRRWRASQRLQGVRAPNHAGRSVRTRSVPTPHGLSASFFRTAARTRADLLQLAPVFPRALLYEKKNEAEVGLQAHQQQTWRGTITGLPRSAEIIVVGVREGDAQARPLCRSISKKKKSKEFPVCITNQTRISSRKPRPTRYLSGGRHSAR